MKTVFRILINDKNKLIRYPQYSPEFPCPKNTPNPNNNPAFPPQSWLLPSAAILLSDITHDVTHSHRELRSHKALKLDHWTPFYGMNDQNTSPENVRYQYSLLRITSILHKRRRFQQIYKLTFLKSLNIHSDSCYVKIVSLQNHVLLSLFFTSPPQWVGITHWSGFDYRHGFLSSPVRTVLEIP